MYEINVNNPILLIDLLNIYHHLNKLSKCQGFTWVFKNGSVCTYTSRKIYLCIFLLLAYCNSINICILYDTYYTNFIAAKFYYFNDYVY